MVKVSKDILLRSVPLDQHQKLKELAKLNNKKSVNEYLLWLIERVCTDDYVINSEIRMQNIIGNYESLLEVMMKRLEENEIVMQKILER